MKYSQGLTIEDLKKAVEKLESEKPKPFNIVASPLLKGMQAVIKSGENIYYSPDITSGEVKVIELPTFEDIITDRGANANAHAESTRLTKKYFREAVEKGIKF